MKDSEPLTCAVEGCDGMHPNATAEHPGRALGWRCSKHEIWPPPTNTEPQVFEFKRCGQCVCDERLCHICTHNRNVVQFWETKFNDLKKQAREEIAALELQLSEVKRMADFEPPKWEHSACWMDSRWFDRVGVKLESPMVSSESHRETIWTCRRLWDECVRLRKKEEEG